MRVSWRLLSVIVLALLILSGSGPGAAQAARADRVSATRFDVVASTTSPSAGVPFTVTITARTPSGLPAYSYTGSIDVTAGDGGTQFTTRVRFGWRDRGARTVSILLYEAGPREIQARDIRRPSLQGAATVDVQPGPLVAISLLAPEWARVGQPFTVIPVGEDLYGNVVDLRGRAVLSASSGLTIDQSGEAVATRAGLHSITARVDAMVASVQIDAFGAPVALHLSAPSNATAGRAFAVTVEVLDAGGNLVRDYAGTVRLTSSDPNASLPEDYTFGPGDEGSARLRVTLTTLGAQTLTATALDGLPASTSAITVRSSGS